LEWGGASPPPDCGRTQVEDNPHRPTQTSFNEVSCAQIWHPRGHGIGGGLVEEPVELASVDAKPGNLLGRLDGKCSRYGVASSMGPIIQSSPWITGGSEITLREAGRTVRLPRKVGNYEGIATFEIGSPLVLGSERSRRGRFNEDGAGNRTSRLGGPASGPRPPSASAGKLLRQALVSCGPHVASHVWMGRVRDHALAARPHPIGVLTGMGRTAGWSSLPAPGVSLRRPLRPFQARCPCHGGSSKNLPLRTCVPRRDEWGRTSSTFPFMDVPE